MKIILGSIEIDTQRVSHAERTGHRLCKIGFVTGNSILVTCGVDSKDGSISFKGSVNELKRIIFDNE